MVCSRFSFQQSFSYSSFAKLCNKLNKSICNSYNGKSVALKVYFIEKVSVLCVVANLYE